MSQNNPHQSPEHDTSKQMTDQLMGSGKKLGKEVGKEVGNQAKKAGKEVGKKIGKKLLQLGAKALQKVAVSIISALAKVVAVLLPYILIILAVVVVIGAIWFIVYEVRGEGQDYAMEPKVEENNKSTDFVQGKGYFSQVDELSGENKAIQEFYSYYGGRRSYWQIPMDGGEELIRGDKPEAVEDYYKKEKRYTINKDFIFALDEYVYNRKLRFPEQFVEPVKFNRDEMKLLHLTEDKTGLLTAESTKYDKKGMKTEEKEKGVWDYGVGSIFKYKEDKITRTVEGTYNSKDVWDEGSKSVKQVAINEPFVEMMDGYPVKIHLMTDAVTFTGDYKFEYEYVKTMLAGAEGQLRQGDGAGKANEPVNRIQYGTADEYRDVPVYGEVEYKDANGKSAYRTEQTGTRKEFVKTHNLYKYRTGAVYETIPVEVTKEETLTEEEKKKKNEERLRYLQDYLFYFISYIPDSVMEGFNFEERVGSLIQTNMDLGGTANYNNNNFAGAMQHMDTVKKYSEIYGVEPEAIIAMIAQETGGKANIKDGVMQITGSGKRCIQPTGGPEACVYNQADRKNPDKAIAWGVASFKVKLDKYNGDYLKAIQSHNLDPAWIFKTYPETANSLDWLNYREEMREHYGMAEKNVLTKSASYDCIPGFDKSSLSGRSVYGDVCYLEHVLRYYNGTMLTGLDKVDTPTTGEAVVDKIANAVKGFFGISQKDYLEDERRFVFKHRMDDFETDILLRAVKTFTDEILFSSVEDDSTDLAFWDKGAGNGSAGSGAGKSLSKEEFLAIVGDTQFAPPLDIPNPRVTAMYGSIDSAHSTPHQGMDIGVPVGTPLYAVSNGVIDRAVNNQGSSKTGWGNYVRIKMDDGNYVLYGHMNYVEVKQGDRVEMGDYIGDTGNSGSSTGPHLHFELTIQSPDRSASADPQYIVLQPHLFK